MNAISEKEIQAYHKAAAEFARREIRPAALDFDRFPFTDFNRNLVSRLDAGDFLVPTLPEAYDGAAADRGTLAAILEELAAEDASAAFLVLVQSLFFELLEKLGGGAFIKKWVLASGQGDPVLFSLPCYMDPESLPSSVTVSGSGSDYLLSGYLDLVPCLPVAAAVMVPAVFKDSGRPGLFLLDTGAEGMTIRKPVVTLGLRGCPVADLLLENVSLAADRYLGAADGFKIYNEVVEGFRGALAAIAVGILRGAYTTARIYAKERFQAKKQIIEHDMVRSMLAGMVSWIDAGSALVRQMCVAVDTGETRSRSFQISLQNTITMAVTRATTDAVQVLGGYGYMHEYGQEKRMRDAKQLQAVFGAPAEKVMRTIERALS